MQDNEFPETGLCVNVGQSRSYFRDELTGNIWMPDKTYEPGNYGHENGRYYTSWPAMQAWDGIRQGVGQNITGTDLDPVFQTFLTGLTRYQLDVPAGEYEVTLLFAEPFSEDQRRESPEITGAANDGERIFSVEVNGLQVFDSLNISDDYGVSTAFERKIKVESSNNGIEINLIPVKGEPVLNGIKVFKKN